MDSQGENSNDRSIGAGDPTEPTERTRATDSETAGPQSGDRVKATVSDRDAKEVEGILHLRHVPALGYVQVMLVDAKDRLHHVDPKSIEVVERGVVAVEDLERGEPLKGDPGWRRIIDLESAIAEGLVSLESGDGTSWDTLLVRMRLALRSLVEAGWEVFDEETDPSEDDCVVCMLKRPPRYLSVDHYPDGWTLIWETNEQGEGVDSDGEEVLEPTVQIGPDHSASEVRSILEGPGWL